MKTCADCTAPIRPQSLRCRTCAGAARRAPREKGNGYLRVFSPGHELAGKDGYVLSHRLALHNAGIQVPADRHVHHKNGDKRDNRVSNLEVITPSAHSQLHVDSVGFITNQHGTFPIHTRRASVGRQKEGRQ